MGGAARPWVPVDLLAVASAHIEEARPGRRRSVSYRPLWRHARGPLQLLPVEGRLLLEQHQDLRLQRRRAHHDSLRGGDDPVCPGVHGIRIIFRALPAGFRALFMRFRALWVEVHGIRAGDPSLPPGFHALCARFRALPPGFHVL